ncbi:MULTISPECIES: GNAT family N-acetyltransferase [Streptomyces]|uniref:GNAT family N-acetyltransferase n=1 Tax=Streptomyces TaxID=1883 RepID=UPI0013189C6F|nr:MULTISPECIES: GNAT family N-acetyltransferase [Streptomyces]QGZ48993.1 GNAT family N-acetyltransferase [Streptomyces sp. QHH-9511]
MELTLTDLTPDDPALVTDVGPLMETLRPGLGADAFLEFATAAHNQGLVFTAAHDPAGRCVGVATHRVLATSRGRLLFVDDLVTAPAARSAGVGSRLIGELRERARRAGCVRLELDTGTANPGAQRFYHAQRMNIVALHFALDVNADGDMDTDGDAHGSGTGLDGP